MTYAYWDDGEGIVRRSLDDDPSSAERVVAERSIRLVLAATVGGDVALAWVQRILETGRSAYYLRWRGDTRLVESTLLQNAVALGAGPGGPALLLVTRSGSEAHLDLYRWNGKVIRVRSSDKDLDAPSLLFDDTGGAIVAWLEGEVVRTEFGASSEWDAYAAFVAADDRVGAANVLGEAARDGVQFVTRIDWPSQGPQVAWTQTGGALVIARPGEAPQRLGRGHPIGVFGDHFYWSDETSIRRRPIAAVGGDGDSVVWSPNEPERTHGIEHEGHLHLVWYGGNVGGGFAVYTADDRNPIRLGWRDHIAARMGWPPWDFWQALSGQALVSLLIGVLATLALSPLLLIAALVLSRGIPADRGTMAGLSLGLLGLLAIVAVFAWRGAGPNFPGVATLFGTWEIVVAAAIGTGIGWLVRRKADSETAFEIVSSAGISLAVTLSVLGFLHFRAWTQLWG